MVHIKSLFKGIFNIVFVLLGVGFGFYLPLAVIYGEYPIVDLWMTVGYILAYKYFKDIGWIDLDRS